LDCGVFDEPGMGKDWNTIKMNHKSFCVWVYERDVSMEIWILEKIKMLILICLRKKLQ